MEKFDNQQLAEIEAKTLDHYDRNAKAFWSGTKDHDVSQNRQAFLAACEQQPSLDILDFGCGPGRDVYYFKSIGHKPVGLDGSLEFCQHAKTYTQCTILHQQFLNLTLASESFDGVFANASLFHIPSQSLAGVLAQLNHCLRPGGVLFMSNPRGSAEGWNGQRFGHYMEFEQVQVYLKVAGFKVLEHYYRPKDQPRERQPWLAVVGRKPG